MSHEDKTFQIDCTVYTEGSFLSIFYENIFPNGFCEQI